MASGGNSNFQPAGVSVVSGLGSSSTAAGLAVLAAQTRWIFFFYSRFSYWTAIIRRASMTSAAMTVAMARRMACRLMLGCGVLMTRLGGR